MIKKWWEDRRRKNSYKKFRRDTRDKYLHDIQIQVNRVRYHMAQAEVHLRLVESNIEGVQRQDTVYL